MRGRFRGVQYHKEKQLQRSTIIGNLDKGVPQVFCAPLLKMSPLFFFISFTEHETYLNDIFVPMPSLISSVASKLLPHR